MPCATAKGASWTSRPTSAPTPPTCGTRARPRSPRSPPRSSRGSDDIRQIVLSQPEGVTAVFPDEANDELVIPGRNVAGHRVVGLEDEAAALGGVELRQDDPPQLILRALGPCQDVHIAAEGDPVSVLPPQLDDVQPGLGLERVIGVDPGLDEVAEDRPDVAAAVIDHGQPVG